MLTKWRERQTILCGLVGTSLAVCSVMGIQKLIGSRPRPMYEPGDQFLDFFGGEQPSHDISSFPSDTSSLVFGLSTIVFLISKRAGTFAYIWATFVVAFLRVAVGLHYPSDVITSACNGTAMVLLLSRGYALWTDVRFSQFVVRYKASLYALAFGVLFEMTRLGGDLRPFLDSILRGTIAFLR
jgi:undecaprenyl-diphosphatase